VAGKAIAPAPALPAPAPATALPTAPQSRSTTRGTYDAFVPQPGNAPSTLQAQAAALGRGQQPVQPAYRVAAGPGAEAPPQPTFNLRGPLPAAATPAPAPHPGSGGFQIQIGAYPSAAEAERALADVRSRAGDLVKSAGGAALPAVKDNRQIYRARFAGYDARSAAGTCLELRRRQIDCFVMKAE
jgi:D-alanyl-D-alanine carboxypeptidase